MKEKVLITGATGFLGRAVIEKLLKRNKSITALVLKNDPLVKYLPKGISLVCGDVCDDSSLRHFFSHADRSTCVIHCAGIVSVATHPRESLYKANVVGTNNILFYCAKHHVKKLVYVSSVHALPESSSTAITEEAFVPSLRQIQGHYGKSKAIATSLVFEAAARGLDASVVYPSGIIGPGDFGKGSITSLLVSYLKGKLPFAVTGGYDFVDVRDVAKGIVTCLEWGESGRGYILSGHYATIREILNNVKIEAEKIYTPLYLPAWLAQLAAPYFEKRCLKRNLPLSFTPNAVSVLRSPAKFSHRSAETHLGYSPRPLRSTLRDTVRWLNRYVLQTAPSS